MSLTVGSPLFQSDTRLRVKKINRTTHVFLGKATSYVGIGNDYTVNHGP